MKLIAFILFLAGSLTASAIEIKGLEDSQLFSDSGINGPAYSKIVSDSKMAAAKYPQYAEYVEYGKSVEGRPLHLVRLSNKRAPRLRDSKAPALLISGATHGNEYLNIVDRMPGYFLKNRNSLPGLRAFINQGGVVYIVPILNPDGFSRDRRANANRVDLNRDFDLKPRQLKRFTQPETSELIDYLIKDVSQSSLKLEVTMDYHCCIGAWLTPWSYSSRRLTPANKKRFDDLVASFKDYFPAKYKVGSTYDVLRYFAVGTSKDYYFIEFDALAFTFEGEYRKEKGRFDAHIKMWEKIFARFAG